MGVESFDHQIDLLIKSYKDAYVQAIDRLNELVIKGRDIKHAKAIVQQIKSEMISLDATTAKWIEKNIPKAYRDGYDNAYGIFSSGKSSIGVRNFSQLHLQAIEIIAYNLQDSLSQATGRIGRESDDIYRKIQLEAVQKKAFLGESVNYTKNEIIEKLKNQGITAFRDKLGRNWNLASYAELCARTVTAQAVSMGTENRAIEDGFDLIIVSEHHPTCEICAPLAGKVYSLTGKTKGYPIWKRYIPAHPNCRHGVSIYQPQFDPNAEERKKFSNTSLSVDPRTDVEKRDYKASQDKNRQLRNNRNQWQRYRMLLSNQTPASFGAFSRMKYSNSQKWQELQTDYRSLTHTRNKY